MKPLTRHQRAAIYRQAAERIFDREGDEYACGNIAQIIYDLAIRTTYSTILADAHDFPELYLFKPMKRHKITWWSFVTKGRTAASSLYYSRQK